MYTTPGKCKAGGFTAENAEIAERREERVSRKRPCNSVCSGLAS
jgi:hypothetical protein